MDKELKITVLTVAIFVISIIGIAFIMSPGETQKEETVSKTESTSTATLPKNESASNNSQKNSMSQETTQKKYTQATITTNKGVIEIQFLETAPKTVANFGTLASSNFYDGVRFHRVIKGFMIQGGDPLSKDTSNKSVWGTGGPGYRFEDELKGDEQYTLGTLAMANAGPNTNGSQFFIVTAQPGVPLPPSYTVFGKVTKGIEVALAIEKVATNSQDQPLEDVVIENIEVK